MASAQTRESLISIQRQFSYQPPHIRQMDRLHPGLKATLSQLRQATFENWQSFGFNQLKKEGLGVVLSDRNGYAIVAETKTATNSSLDMLLVCLPHTGSPITHTVDELPQPVQEDLFSAIEHGISAIEQVAKQNQQQLVRIYIQQHVAAEEQNEYVFKNTFPQTHFHLIGVTQEDLEQSDHNPNRPRSADRRDRYRFSDPTITLAYDLYRERFGSAELDSQTAAVVVTRRTGQKAPTTIPQEERRQIADIMASWKTAWKEVAACFTDFGKDEFQRLLPAPSKERMKRVQEFIENHPTLSPSSQEILHYLAENLSAFNQHHVLSALYNSIAGSVGWTIDYDNQTTTLRFAPRTFVSPNKVGATDGMYVAIKHRGTYMEEHQREQYLALQRQLIQSITAETAIAPVRNGSLELLPSLPFNPYAYIDTNHNVIYKTHRRFSQQDILNRYDALQRAGVMLGDRPIFTDSPSYGVVEIDPLVNGKNGSEYMQHADDTASLTLYTNTLLGNVKNVIDAQGWPQTLAFAIDAVPQNFVWDPVHSEFVYIDYEPLDSLNSHTHLLSPAQLVNYTLVKFGREKPALFAEALAATNNMFSGTLVEQYLQQLPYDRIQTLLKRKDFGQARNVISGITEKDELLGAAIMLIANLEDRGFTRAAGRIRQMFPGKLMQQESNSDRETVGNFLIRTLSRKDTVAYQQALFSLLED